MLTVLKKIWSHEKYLYIDVFIWKAEEDKLKIMDVDIFMIIVMREKQILRLQNEISLFKIFDYNCPRKGNLCTINSIF